MKDKLEKSKTFCVAPWMHTHIWPNGKVYPCCMSNVRDGNDFGNVGDSSFEDIWNNEKYKQFRLDLLNGVERPDVCYRCYSLEASDKVTLRNDLNRDYLESTLDNITNTKEDGSADLTLKYWDFRFNNICNLSCRTCGPDLSSSWVDDHNKLYKVKNKKFLSINDYGKVYEDLTDSQIDNVESIYFAGGEPLLMNEHHYILTMLDQKQKYNVKIIYSTNGTTLSYKKTYFPDIWKKFKEVWVFISLDEIYERAEYWRNGTKWNTLHNNIIELNEICKHNSNIKLGFNPTISMFNIHRLKDYLIYLNENGLLDNKNNGVNLNLLIDPSYFNIQSLPHKYKEYLKQTLVDCEEYYNSIGRSFMADNTFEMLVKWIDVEDPNSLSNLKEGARILARLDKIRDQRLSAVAPEIYDLYKEYGYDEHYNHFNVKK